MIFLKIAVITTVCGFALFLMVLAIHGNKNAVDGKAYRVGCLTASLSITAFTSQAFWDTVII